MSSKYLKGSLGILLSFILSCGQLPISSDAQFGILREVGKSLLKKKESYRPDDFSYSPLRNKKAVSYVNLVGKKLLASSKEEIDFHILASPYIQAFTDYSEVYVTQGMLNTISNEAELASLLSHEIGHIRLKHWKSEFKDKGRLWDIITDEAENQSGLNVGLSDYRYDIAYANFEKDKEEKADELGAELVAKKGYNPYALCDLFERLSQNAKDGVFVQIGNLTGSHKSLKERAEHLRKFLASKGYKQIRKGFFTHKYQSTLLSLTSDKNLSLTSQDRKILIEVASYQQEVERYQKLKQPLPTKRFTHIMSKVLDLTDKYHFSKESLLLDSKPYEAFMQERLLQRNPLWGTFNSMLNAQLTFLVASMALSKISLSGAYIAAESVIGNILNAPAAFVGSAAVLGYALHKATQSSESDSEVQPKKIFGETGVQVTSKTVWKGKGKERMDVENPNPGKRPGQIHHQDNEGNKYLYDPKTDKFIGAPKKVNDLLNTPDFRNGINKAMKYLGEQ